MKLPIEIVYFLLGVLVQLLFGLIGVAVFLLIFLLVRLHKKKCQTTKKV